MLTDRFIRLRKEQLEDLFEKKRLIDTWRNVVRSQLRRLDIKDLFDYYDFNYKVEDQALAIRTDVLNGNYNISQPLIYRIEKKLGICRHIVIPQPADALVLQVITENIAGEIIRKQPSRNTFYSQDRHAVRKPHEVEGGDYTNWFSLWKKLQKTIYNFNLQKDLLVVTDLSNYYDSIDVDALKKSMLNLADDKETKIDLLFKIIEEISWRPDYLPYMRRGLPTSNLEGIRLLAHSFLFELDQILEQRSNSSFTRWMDDVIIAVDTKSEAINNLSSASDVLKSKGLALNLAKTHIYNAEEGRYHFQIDANIYLDEIDTKVTKGSEEYENLIDELKLKFEGHLEDRNPKYWDKITKRYISTLGTLNSDILLSNVSALYGDIPSIRSNLLKYLFTIGYNSDTAKITLRILESLNLHDDISLFEICKLLTDWKIPVSDDSRAFLDQFERKITGISGRRKNSFDFYCLLWFKAKYNHPLELSSFIEKYKYIWRLTPFLKRQATALMSRLIITQEKKSLDFLHMQISTGDIQTISLANLILELKDVEKLNKKLTFYLFPQMGSKSVYPLSKFLILCTVLSSERFRNDKSVTKLVQEKIHDPYYRKWIEAFYNIRMT